MTFNEEVETETNHSKVDIEDQKKLEQALKNATIEVQIPDNDMFQNILDVSAGLTNPTRILYAKVAKKAQYIDDFLARRLQLKSLEKERIELNQLEQDMIDVGLHPVSILSCQWS